jgi:hypothetical protein
VSYRIARVFWTSFRSMAHFSKISTHTFRGGFHLRVVCRTRALLRQLFYIAFELCLPLNSPVVLRTATISKSPGQWYRFTLLCLFFIALIHHSPFVATGDVRDDSNQLCSYQLDLIGVVMVALLLYVTNLVISLFRIFEKVKVHQGWGYGRH